MLVAWLLTLSLVDLLMTDGLQEGKKIDISVKFSKLRPSYGGRKLEQCMPRKSLGKWKYCILLL